MTTPDEDELDRLFLLWKNSLWPAFGVSAAQAEKKRDLYRFRITGIGRPAADLVELHIEFPANAVFGVAYLSGSKVSVVLPLFERGEVNAPPGRPHLLAEFICGGGIEPANFIGEDADGNPRVRWDSTA